MTMSTDKDKEDSTCDECGRFLDEWEIDDFYYVPMCLECVKCVRLLQVQHKLPANFDVKEVTETEYQHRKPCSDCGKAEWRCGERYVYDTLNPWGDSDEYCLECAESRDWCPEKDSDEFCGIYVPVIHVPPSPSNTSTASKKQRTS